MKYVIPIIHLILAAHYLYGIYVYLRLVAPPEIAITRLAYGGPFKFLTFIDMILQAIYFVLALVNDFVGSNTKDFNRSKKLQKMRDFFFTTLVASVGAFVSVSFWVLFGINRDLIFPRVYDQFFPSWLNHNVHTTPIIGVLVEMWMCPHAYPSTRKGFLTVGSMIVLYALWICLIAFETGVWVYPILERLPMVGRIAFITALAFLAQLFYVAGEKVNNRMWGISKRKIKKSQ